MGERRFCAALVLCLGVLFVASSAHAQAAAQGPSPVVPGIGDPRSITQSPAFGVLSEQLNLALPPGRRNLVPRLAFTYSSAGGLDDLGVGWSLTAGRIDRSPKKGVPRFTDADLFAFSLGSSSGDLTEITPGNYRARLESQYRTFARSADGWVAVESQGTVYRFGTTAASRVADSTGTHIASWLLDSIQDRNGNTVSFGYENNGGALYLNVVQYTGYAPTHDPGPNRIDFEYEERPDARITYSQGVRLERHRRLHRISMHAGTALVRRYVVHYDQSTANGRSLVSQLDLVGADDVQTVVARKYQYQSRTLGWAGTSVGTPPASFNDSDGRDLGVHVADVNGDGYTDFVRNDGTVLLGDGHGGYAQSATFTSSFQAAGLGFVDDKGIDKGLRLMDVNGDSRPDLLIATSGGATRRVYLNTGSGWALDANYTSSIANISETAHASLQFFNTPCAGPDAGTGTGLPSCNQQLDYQIPFSLVQDKGDSSGAQLADVNGDGLVDILWSYRTTPQLFNFVAPSVGDAGPPPPIGRIPGDVRAVYLNTGSGFVRDGHLSASLPVDPFVNDTHLGGWDSLDVNGDGLTDLVRTSTEFVRTVLLGDGSGWTEDAGYTASLLASPIFSINDKAKSQGLLPLDYNGDGLVDYVRADDSQTVAYTNTGVGWASDAAMTSIVAALGIKIATGAGVPAGTNVADVDGDGIDDLLEAKSGGAQAILLGRGPVADLLVHGGTALGETTDVTYAPSTHFVNVDGAGLQTLPTVFQLPTSIRRGDGLGASYLFNYGYAGGKLANRIYRGFATGTITDPVGTKQLFAFAQDEALLGQIQSSQTFDAGGTLRARKTSTIVLATPVAGVTQAELVQLDEETLDPADSRHAAGSLHTRTRTAYDAFLNTVEVDKDGDVTVTGDEARTVITHVNNASAGIVDATARLSVYDASGALVSESVTLYDGLAEGQVDKGNPTRIVDTVQIGGAAVSRTMEYDAFGNVSRGSDFLAHFGSFAYDGTNNAFRTKVVDANGRVTTAIYDPRFGIPTSETDANGRVTTRTVDAFGRILVETRPGDETSPFGSRTSTFSALGDPHTQSIKVTATATAGTSDVVATTTFVDGFGQAYRMESQGDGPKKVLSTYTFDFAGSTVATSRPYFDGDSPPLTTYTRDPLRRLTQVTEADGISHNVFYYGTTVEVVDRRNNLTRTLRDAYGKTLEEHVFVGGHENVTRYTYDVVGHTTQVIDAAGERTSITYDALGRKTQLVDPALGTFQYGYDADGNLVTQTEPNGKVTHFTYDAARELIKKDLADGQHLQFVYDGAVRTNTLGRISHVVDAAGSVDVEYDAHGNVTKRKRHIGSDTFITQYTYDSLDRVRHMVYPDGYAVDYTYGKAGYPSRIVDAQGSVLVDHVTYTATGQIADIGYGNGVDSQRTYDVLSRLEHLTTKSASGRTVQNKEHIYDPLGNVTEIADLGFNHDQLFAYDESSRLTHASGTYGDETYAYDAIGNLVRKGSLFMGYDAAHPQRVQCGLDASVARNPLATLLASITAPADVQACLAAVQSQATAQPVPTSVWHSELDANTFFTKYDSRGNVIQKNDTHYVYDDENRLVQISKGLGWLEENIYDAGGARVIRRALVGPQTIFIDGLFELDALQVKRHVHLGPLLVATVSAPSALVHLVTDPGVNSLFDWNAITAWVVAFFHSFLGQWLFSSLSPALATLAFLGLRWLAIALFTRGTVVLRGVRRAARARPVRWAISTAMIPVLLAYTTGGWAAPQQTQTLVAPTTKVFYHLDHIGNVEVVTDSSGADVQRYEYKPFGEQRWKDSLSFWHDADDPGSDLKPSFDGHRMDQQTGLYYFGARHYDPLLGRYLTADTQVQNPENPATLHRYSLDANNPLRYSDPTGHGLFDVILGVVVAVLIVVAVVVVSIGTAGVGDVLFAVAVGVLVGAGVGAAVGAVIALAKYGNLTSAASLRLILGSAFVGALVGASVGFIVGVGGVSAAFSADSLADWATHDLVTNVLIGAASGAAGAEVGSDPNDPNFGKNLFLGSAIGAGVGAVSAVSDGLSGVWEPIPWKPELIAGIVAVIGGADAGLNTANGFVCAKTGGVCLTDYLSPQTELSYNAQALESGTTTQSLTDGATHGVPAWTFGGTSLASPGFSLMNRGEFNAYPTVP